MASHLVVKYEFDDYALFPDEKVLLRLNRPIPMAGKDFEILSYLVQHPNTFISKKEIVESVWGPNIVVADSNMSHLISKIRKAIGCDARNPKYIRTIYNKDGYRFIGTVRETEAADDRLLRIRKGRGSNATHQVTSHLYVPVFLGDDTYRKLNLPETRNDWIEYKVHQTETGILCISSGGFGVWHLTQKHTVRDVSQIARWRRRTYDEILKRKHSITSRTNEFLKSVGVNRSEARQIGKFGYVFSVIELEGTSLGRKEARRNLLKALASLSLFEGAQTQTTETESREMSILAGELELHDLEEFGQAGIDLGFAGWGGVSYFHSDHDGPSISEKLVEFEIGVQSLWWACKCVFAMRFARDPNFTASVRDLTTTIRRNYARLRIILPTESPSQRSMVEAVLNTSRIRQLVEAALDDA
jgi:DNA-binding winged helix-turn-helix (wHTH) protein